ncbi:hypothetical protein [Pseudomonas sp. MWU15-20650]|uniref:DUF6124 family protein n=1 Tax=Pseudomonas sp. MWU15-20650 TaxID=2933107 RepID=UPI00200EE8C2|nr:hypothetical protein [Pseudomonas sp. MWU15-20650]
MARFGWKRLERRVPSNNLKTFDLDISQRAIMLGIQQMAELGQLLVDRALEQASSHILISLGWGQRLLMNNYSDRNDLPPSLIDGSLNHS